MKTTEGGPGGVIICLGVGGLVDLASLLGLENEEDSEDDFGGVEVWVLDARRPWNLTNVFGGYQKNSAPADVQPTTSRPASGVDHGCVQRSYRPGAGGIIMFLLEIVVLILVIAAAILLVQGVRKIPVQYAKRIVGNKQYGGARQYIPLKVNAANVMPIIFAQAIMFLPTLLSGFQSTKGIAAILSDHGNFWYMLVYSILVIGFTFVTF